ncbi:MAG: DEAD/DEAH box helicase family protein, partial [Bacteroidaceae bacterium]|nr:DEAD/DEAH box helicase family protein [Bacteroidaceae bacterium]
MNDKNGLLRDYQQEMVFRIHEAWRHHRSVMVQMPTGTGKTHVLAEVVKS